MASAVNYSHAEKSVDDYWKYIYHNQDGSKTPQLEKIISPGIVVDSIVTSNGQTNVSQCRGLQELLPVLSAMSQAIVKDLSLKLTIYQKEPENNLLKLSYHFEQVLVVKTPEKGVLAKMTSKGTQIWTATKEGLLVSLNVTETDSIQEPYELEKVLNAVNLTGQDSPKAPVNNSFCILV